MADKNIALGTGEITDGSQVPFTIPASFYRFGNVVVTVEGLGAAETVSLWKWVNGDWEEVTDSAGDQIVFSNTAADHALTGGRHFGVTKTATSGALALVVEDPRG